MGRRIASLFFLIILASGVVSGTPLADNRVKNEMCRVNCCHHQAESATPNQADIADLCRTINCTTSAPTPTTSARMRLAPVLVILKTFPIFRLPFTTQSKVITQSFDVKKTVLLNISQPKYIQNQSFLI